jgi:hypothetical protein
MIKTVDAAMRDACGYGHPIKAANNLQWFQKLVRQEVDIWLRQKKAQEAKEAQKLRIDFSQLDTIRRNAALTREALLVDEERMEDPDPVPEVPCSMPQTPTLSPEKPAAPSESAALPDCPGAAALPADTPLSAEEYRLMQCLLYGRDIGWVHSTGQLLSVLVDSINEKLYDNFFDTVLEGDPPEPVEDYIFDLKEMILP